MASQPSYDLSSKLPGDALMDAANYDIEYRSFPAGATIIEQGDDSTDVFTLIDGRAIAIQDGIKVGEIVEGDIFGAIAAFTGSKRQATVVATQDCVVRAIARKTFVALLKEKPEIAEAIK